MIDVSKINVGDRIVFRSPTRDGCRKANRIVTGFWNQYSEHRQPTVRYFGWSNFAVKASEIIEHIPAGGTHEHI